MTSGETGLRRWNLELLVAIGGQRRLQLAGYPVHQARFLHTQGFFSCLRQSERLQESFVKFRRRMFASLLLQLCELLFSASELKSRDRYAHLMPPRLTCSYGVTRPARFELATSRSGGERSIH
jgi:hypothetical protein